MAGPGGVSAGTSNFNMEDYIPDPKPVDFKEGDSVIEAGSNFCRENRKTCILGAVGGVFAAVSFGIWSKRRSIPMEEGMAVDIPLGGENSNFLFRFFDSIDLITIEVDRNKLISLVREVNLRNRELFRKNFHELRRSDWGFASDEMIALLLRYRKLDEEVVPGIFKLAENVNEAMRSALGASGNQMLRRSGQNSLVEVSETYELAKSHPDRFEEMNLFDGFEGGRLRRLSVMTDGFFSPDLSLHATVDELKLMSSLLDNIFYHTAAAVISDLNHSSEGIAFLREADLLNSTNLRSPDEMMARLIVQLKKRDDADQNAINYLAQLVRTNLDLKDRIRTEMAGSPN